MLVWHLRCSEGCKKHPCQSVSMSSEMFTITRAPMMGLYYLLKLDPGLFSFSFTNFIGEKFAP